MVGLISAKYLVDRSSAGVAIFINTERPPSFVFYVHKWVQKDSDLQDYLRLAIYVKIFSRLQFKFSCLEKFEASKNYINSISKWVIFQEKGPRVFCNPTYVP